MVRYIAKLSRQKEQVKLTIPKEFVKLAGLDDFAYISFQIIGRGKFKMRGLNVPDLKEK